MKNDKHVTESSSVQRSERVSPHSMRLLADHVGDVCRHLLDDALVEELELAELAHVVGPGKKEVRIENERERGGERLT